MADTPGIISNTIMINLGDSLSNINEVKKGLKDVQSALKTMEQDQGKSAMVNGTLMDAKELQKVIQRLQSDMKAMQGTSSVKSKATKGIDDAVVETEKKLKTLQGKVREAMTNADKAWQDGTGFKGAKQSFNDALNQLTAFKRDLGTLSIGQEKSLYTNLRRGLNDSSASAKVLTERIKELNAEVAKNKARDSVATPKETLPKQPTIGSSQISDGIKEAKANIKAINKDLFEQLQKNNQKETLRTEELRRQKAELEAQLSALKSIKSTDTKATNANLLATQNANASKQYWKDQETLRNQRTSQLQGQMQGQQKIANADNTKFKDDQKNIARLTQQYDKLYSGIAKSITNNRRLSEEAFNAVKSQASIKAAQLSNYGASPMNQGALGNLSYAQYSQQFKPSDYVSFQRQIANAKAETEKLYQVMTKVNTLQSRIDFANAKKGLMDAEKASEAFNKSIGACGESINKLGSFGQKLRSHLWWMLSGSLLAATFAIPSEVISNITKLEEAMAGVRQVLPQIEHDQALVNKEAKEFIGIAQRYGAATLEVVDAGRSWARMYKDIDTVNALTSISTKIAVADNISLTDALKGSEAAMAQFGMRSENYADNINNANRVADVMTKVAHTGAASAADLANAIERAGSSAHQAGVGFEFFNALVATGVRNTARSGAEIGQSLKSMFTSIHSNKAIAEIEKLGISVYKFNEDGTKSFRSVQDVILDLSLAIQNTEKDTSKLELALGGGKWQVSKITAIMTDYQEIIKMWKSAVDSAGFTNEQVAIQLDTISRKFQTTKALFDEVVAGIANAGLGKFIKEQIEGVNNFLRGLTSISSTIYQNIATTAKWSVELYVAYNAIKWLVAGTTALSAAISVNSVVKNVNTKATVEEAMAESMGMRAKTGSTLANGANTIATNVNTAAKTTATIATTALSRAQAISAAVMGNIVPLLIIAGSAAYSYAQSVGEANDKTTKLAQAEEARIETINRTMESTKQEADFVTKVSDAYDKQSAELAKVGEASEKGKKIKKELIYLEEAITDELYKNTGVSAENREAVVKDGKINRDVIEKNLKAKEIHSKELARALIQDSVNLQADADNNRRWANSKIDNMEKEIRGLGFLQQAWLKYLGFMSKVHGQLADNAEKFAKEQNENSVTWDSKTNSWTKGVNPEVVKANEELAKMHREAQESYKNERVQNFSEQIGALQALKSADDQARLSRSIRTGYTAPKGLNEDAEIDDDGKGTTAGTTPSYADPSTAQNSLELKRYTKNLFAILDANKAKYQEALEDLSTIIAIHGDNSVEAITARNQLEKVRESQLQAEIEALKAHKASLESKVADSVAKYPDFKPMIDAGKLVDTPLPTYGDVDIDNVKPQVKTTAALLIAQINKELGVDAVVTSGYREGDPGGHGKGNKLDIGWDGMQWGDSAFTRAVAMAESAGFKVYTVPHGTGAHLDINGEGLPENLITTALQKIDSDMTKDKWGTLSTKEQAQWKVDNKDIIQESPVVSAVLSALDEIAKVLNEKSKDLNKTGEEAKQKQLKDSQNSEVKYQRRVDGIRNGTETAKANASDPLNRARESDMIRIDLDEAIELRRVYNDRIKELEREKAVFVKAGNEYEAQQRQQQIDKELVLVAQTNAKIKQLEYDKNAKIKEGMAGITSDILVQGNTLRQIWDKLWNDLANDAIKALFRVNNSTPSLLGSILGLFGGGGATAATGGTSWGNSFGTSVSGGMFKFADGGISDKPAIFGEAGAEMAIPLTQGKRGRALDLYAKTGALLGVNRGTEVTASVSPRTMEIAQQSSATAQMAKVNAEHLSKLDTQIGLMTQQNSMILTMLGQDGGQGGVVQPIVMSQSMDKGQLWSMIESMRRDGYKV